MENQQKRLEKIVEASEINVNQNQNPNVIVNVIGLQEPIQQNINIRREEE